MFLFDSICPKQLPGLWWVRLSYPQCRSGTSADPIIHGPLCGEDPSVRARTCISSEVRIERMSRTGGRAEPRLPSTTTGVSRSREPRVSCPWCRPGPGGCEPLAPAVTRAPCVRDPKLHGLLLQLSRLACHLENIIYFCLLYLKTNT